MKPEHDGISRQLEQDLTGLTSRRNFLTSLGALALTACGGGTTESPSVATRLLATVATTSGAFVHPGLLHSRADFDRMAQRYQTAPWSDSWNLLVTNPKVTLSYSSGPLPIIYRGPNVTQNFGRLVNECIAMYGMALRWKVTGDARWAAKATSMLNGWTATLTSIQGADAALVAGPQGLEIANIAEMLRDYSGFTAANLEAVKTMLRNVFYPICHTLLSNHFNQDPTHVAANWDCYNMAGMAAIGVLCDDQAMFDEALAYFRNGTGNGAIRHAAYYMFPGYLCEWQESGRDQAHTMDGMDGMGALCEIAWHQGVDLYSYDNNRLLAGAEYIAKSNLIESGTSYYTVPYVPYQNDAITWATFSTSLRGYVTPSWAILHNHYVNRMGLSAPYTKKMAQTVGPAGAWNDVVGYGILSYQTDPIATGAQPSGLTAYTSGGGVVLSWWGGAYDTGYTVKRSAMPGGPYTTIASGITDLRSYTDTPADGTWYYIVTATTPSGESAPSNEVAIVAGVQLHTRLLFNEGSGADAADASGYGHAATLAGGAAWTTGRQNGALALNGSNAYAVLPGKLMDDVGDFTISTWVYWNAARNWERVFDFGSGTDRYMMLTARAGTGVARFAMTVNGKFGERAITSNIALPTGRWVHVAVTLNGLTGTLYIDGVAVGTNTNLFLAPFRIWDTDQNWLGRSHYPNDPYFNGNIDDFRIYRGALSATDIASLAQGPVDMGGGVQLTQQGATYNRVTQKYVGSVSVTNMGTAALTGPFQLELSGLSPGVSLDNASGRNGVTPYVTVNGTLAPGAVLNVPLTFSNPSRGMVAYTLRLLRGYF